MKDRLRLAQSLDPQGFENMGILRDFSSLPEAVSTARQKRDSQAYSARPKRVFLRFSVWRGG
jgi:hypothetical protein